MDSHSNPGRGDRASTKKRRHRGPRRKKNRRPSFAPPVIESPGLSPSRRPEGEANVGDENAAQPSTDSRQRRLYRLGQLGEQNLSGTSLDSEALLDHRDQPMMRPRRDSRLAQSTRPDPSSPESPHGTRQQTSRTRPWRFTSSSQPVQDDESEEADDRTPLMKPSSIHNSNFVRYGTNRNKSYSPRRPSLSIPVASSRRSPPASYIPGASIESQPEYDVNNPPSVPGSPKTGLEMGYDDAIIVGQELNRTASPQSATSLPLDAVIDMDGNRMAAGTGSIHGSPMMSPPDLQRRRTVTLPVEEDVCFPAGGLSDLAEEDTTAHAPSEEYPQGRRRRRRRIWPDLSALEEWSHEEKEARSGGIRAKRISEPVLVGGRLRPRNSGWEQDEEEAPFRFTYFNEEFQSTIHSQTISELVQPGQTFRNLFIPDPPELESESDEDETPETNRSRSHSLSPHKNHRSNTSDLLSHDEHGSGTWSPGHKAPFPKPAKEIRYGPRPTFWLDILSPTDSEMRVISKAFGIHALTAEDIMTQEAREKVELFRHYYFINYRTFEQDKNSPNFLDPVNMYVVVFRDGLLSFHFSRVPHPANVRRRVRQLRDYLILSADWISYALIDDITDVFGPLIHNVEDEVDDIDDMILRLQDMSVAGTAATGNETESVDLPLSGSDMLRRVGACRKKVMGLYRLLGNKADVIKGFAKRCNEQWEVAPKSEIGLYLGDIQDHILTMTGNLTHYETLLSRAHSNYLAQINIRMNERQEQTADVLGKLTVLGTIVLPMNIICGMWGMNVKVPGQDVDSLTWFLSITAGLIVFAVVCFYVAKRVYGIV